MFNIPISTETLEKNVCFRQKSRLGHNKLHLKIIIYIGRTCLTCQPSYALIEVEDPAYWNTCIPHNG